jgi:hypothetical protein
MAMTTGEPAARPRSHDLVTSLTSGKPRDRLFSQQAQRIREGAKRRRHDPPRALQRYRFRPEVTGDYSRIGRVTAVVQRDRHVITGHPVDSDEEGELDIEPGQLNRASNAAADFAEQLRPPALVSEQVKRLRLPAHLTNTRQKDQRTLEPGDDLTHHVVTRMPPPPSGEQVGQQAWKRQSTDTLPRPTLAALTMTHSSSLAQPHPDTQGLTAAFTRQHARLPHFAKIP